MAVRSMALVTLGAIGAVAGGATRIQRVLDVSPVWSGHPVGFCLLTHDGRQYAAFYDAERRMTVAARALKEDRWQLVRLPERIGWDSHNYIVMTVDDDGQIHLSGNMHCRPLVYFRTKRAGDIGSFERVGSMVGREERRCTYPRFFRGPAGELIFTYRDGGSGNGNQIYNVYDHKTAAWRRLLDAPLTDGQGRMNAYLNGPVRGPGGWWHLCWVWRDTPDCATNHDVSYARSRDLVNWQTIAGKPIKLPMTIATPGLIVDPIPVKGGLLNGCQRIGFDTAGRVIISFHKFDPAGHTQIYNARHEGGRWRIAQVSGWKHRWYFQGGGSIGRTNGLRVGSVRATGDGKLVQRYWHSKHGSGGWLVDERTLKPTGPAPRVAPLPKTLTAVESKLPGMQKRRADDRGRSDRKGVRYVLAWETLGPNRDRPRKGKLPVPSMLRLYRLVGD